MVEGRTVTFDRNAAQSLATEHTILLLNVGGQRANELRREATGRGYRLVEAVDDMGDPPDGLDAVLCVMGARDGVECVAHLRAARRRLGATPIVVVDVEVDTDTAVALVRLGATDVIGAATPSEAALRRMLESLHQPDVSAGAEELVGDSVVIRALRRELQAVAATSSTVLLTGETGTGKGLVARALHKASSRCDRPFVHVDCASLSPTVIESELFGHEKGAFTGAVTRHTGRFELAEHGTVFLDEIGNLSLDLQAKLLRVLQDREYERIGGTRTLAMTARIVAATNRDLKRAVREGAFRADLYYRLNVFHLTIPPLRDRLGDVPLIVRASLPRICQRLGVRVPRLSDGLLARLMAFPWPGNVRELMNLVERLAAQQSDVLLPEQLDGLLDDGSMFEGDVRPPILPLGTAGSAERDHIVATLVATGGNVARAARRLGLPRSTLRYQVRKYGLGSLIPED